MPDAGHDHEGRVSRRVGYSGIRTEYMRAPLSQANGERVTLRRLDPRDIVAENTYGTLTEHISKRGRNA